MTSIGGPEKFMQVVQLLRETKSIKVGPSFILLVIRKILSIYFYIIYIFYS